MLLLHNILNILCSPLERNDIVVDQSEGNSILIDVNTKKPCALIDKAFSRLDWIKYNSYPGLDNDILEEISKYDKWADEQTARFSPASDNYAINDDLQFYKNRFLKRAIPDIESQVKNKVILDIGGSAKDSWRFLLSGAKAIHQIEVSPGSQNLGYQRIKGKAGQNYLDKVVFHTSPAEYLPFKNNSFDFIFSRATIHHTKRNYSLPEIHRVLKPDGAFIAVEPIRSRLVYQLIHIVRRIRKKDRGSDNPLNRDDIALFKKLFTKVEVRPQNYILNDIMITLNWFKIFRLKAGPGVIYAIK